MSLLPCPFCGGDGEVRGQGNQASPIYVKCVKCFAQGPPNNRLDRARQDWNSRMLSPEELAADADSEPMPKPSYVVAKHKFRPAWYVVKLGGGAATVMRTYENAIDPIAASGMARHDAAQLSLGRPMHEWKHDEESERLLRGVPTSKPAEADPPITASTDPRPAEEDDWRLGDRSEDIVIPRGTLKPGDKLTIRGVGLCEVSSSGQWHTIKQIPAKLTVRLGYLADRLAIASGQGVGAYMAELCTQSADAIREVLALVQPTKGGER